ncbi:MAG: 4-carboxymuconolactone decarboxylase [Alphaproteobacteria bacterium]|nr:4-carboxymuconolactone decarboxylase [Alphaproteobacteria bacterium]
MDKQLFEKGLAKRKQVLGTEYVDNMLAQADEFSLPFQEMLTEFCWGGCWGDDRIDDKTRSMMNLTMIAALNRMHEWELHFKGAIKNGVTKDELQAIIHVIAIYCGVPVGVECMRIAKRAFAELEAA